MFYLRKSIFRFYNKIACFAENICSNNNTMSINCYLGEEKKMVFFAQIYSEETLGKKTFSSTNFLSHKGERGLKRSTFFLSYATRTR